MDILESLEQMKTLLDRNPQVKEILAAVETGACSLEQATQQIAECLSDEETQLVVGAQGLIRERLSAYNSNRSSNPLVIAAIIERAFLDGDVPEFRTGPLPPGATPAVPVDTEASNPVMIGLMLERASNSVHQELTRLLEDHGKAVQELIASLPESTSLEALRSQIPEPPTGLQGVYEAGEFPPLMKVPEPTLPEIAALSPSDHRKYVYKAISTTQGRRTMEPTIQKNLAVKLGVVGGRVLHPVAQAHWTIDLRGAQNISQDFSPVDLAVASLARDLINKAGPNHFDVVEVNQVSDIPSRVFGWSAKVGVQS